MSTPRSSPIRRERSALQSSNVAVCESTTYSSDSGLASHSTTCRRSSGYRPTSSRTCFVSHPDRLPDLFLDRSLGRIKVPRLLREAGLRLVTLAEHYGVPADEKVADEDWLELAGKSRWAVFMKD